MTPPESPKRNFFRWALYGLLGIGFLFSLLFGAFLAFPTERLRTRIEWEINQQLSAWNRRPGADILRFRIKNLDLHIWNPTVSLEGITLERMPVLLQDNSAKAATLPVDHFEISTTWIDLLFRREKPHWIQAKWSLLGAQGTLEFTRKEEASPSPGSGAPAKASTEPYRFHAKLSPLSLASLIAFWGDLPIHGMIDAEAEGEVTWPLPTSGLSSVPLHVALHVNDLVVGDDKTPINIRKLLPAGSELLLKQIPPLPKTMLGSFQSTLDGSIAWATGASSSFNLYLRLNPSFATFKQGLLPIIKQLLKENPEVAPLYSPLLANPNPTPTDYERAVERSLTEMQREDKTFGFALTGAPGFLKLVPQKREPSTIDLRNHPLPPGH